MNASSIQRVLVVYWRGGAIDSWRDLLNAGAMPRLALIRDEGALVERVCAAEEPYVAQHGYWWHREPQTERAKSISTAGMPL